MHDAIFDVGRTMISNPLLEIIMSLLQWIVHEFPFTSGFESFDRVFSFMDKINISNSAPCKPGTRESFIKRFNLQNLF